MSWGAEPNTGSVISDRDVVEALDRLGPRETGWPWEYVVDDIRLEPGEVDARVRLADGESVRLGLALPSSGRPQPWLHADVSEADDWVQQLAIWLDEEVATGGFQWAERRGVAPEEYVVVARYGWRRADPAEHERLDEVLRRIAEPRHRRSGLERFRRLRARRSLSDP